VRHFNPAFIEKISVLFDTGNPALTVFARALGIGQFVKLKPRHNRQTAHIRKEVNPEIPSRMGTEAVQIFFVIT
jgi:hypothetical protein